MLNNFLAKLLLKIFKSHIKSIILSKIKNLFFKALTNYAYKYPWIGKTLGKTLIYISLVKGILELIHFYFSTKFPLIYSVIVIIYSSYISSLKGNLDFSTKLVITVYMILFFDLDLFILYFILILGNYLKEYIVGHTGLHSKYPVLCNILVHLLSLINRIVIFIFFYEIFTHVLLPLALKLFNILKMASNPGNNTNSGNIGSNNSGGGTPNNNPEPKNYELFMKKNNRVGKRKAQQREPSEKEKDIADKMDSLELTPEEKNKMDNIMRFIGNRDQHELKLRKVQDDLLDLEHSRRNVYLKDNLKSLTNSYHKLLPKEAKKEYNNIEKDLYSKSLHVNSEDGYGKASSIKEYWTYLQQDTKNIHKGHTKLLSLFEQNAKNIKNNNFGGNDTPKSREFTAHLIRSKDFESKMFNKKKKLITEQINSHKELDTLIKEKICSMEELFEKNVLGKK
uniref:hypothetical protein n=1 Tax=Periconia digitata TaxID=1303443 RepID=UPI0023AA33B3|nr:hypothetical protein P1Q94_mgp25 [Periconia digitata]WCA44871.1 hypothetical protein [Periconia digitata]